jgi:hypothetical protein
MMAYEQKDMTGSAFKNTRKAAETHADYTGTAKLNGVDHWVSIWINKDKNGETYFKLGFKAKDGTAERPANTEQEFKKEVAKHFVLDDDVPFAPEFR